MFELTKWYADAVSAAGDYWIGYCARLKAGGFSLSYSSILDRDGERHSFRPSQIRTAPGEAAWRMPSLGVEARWHGAASPIAKRLFEEDEGAVDWRCLLPTASVETGAVSGLGYVEKLRLTIPPWRLPIRTLRWGRYLSPRHSVIWIDWLGGFRSTSVWIDGVPAAALEIGDEVLVLDGGVRLTFDRGLTIRRGPLGSTVLNGIPGLDRVAPLRFFRVAECKWRSAAVFERANVPPDRGWAIHEVVTWP